jgi:hypothetical protein
MRMFPVAVAGLVAVGLSLSPVRAEAITLREIIELSRAGLGEEVLLALIEIDQRVFPVDPATLRMLKQAGVSEKVIVAMVKSGRTPAPQPEPQPVPVVPSDPPEPPEPQVIVIDHDRPVVREVAVPVPVYIAVPTHRARSVHDSVDTRTVGGVVTTSGNRIPSEYLVDQSRRPAAPVYWGWGGKPRPDAWQPPPEEKRHSQTTNDRTPSNQRRNDRRQ